MHHLRKHNPNYYTCDICQKPNISTGVITQHLSSHGIGYYDCIYCVQSYSRIQLLQNHLCNSHPTRPLYICVRLPSKNCVSSIDKTFQSNFDIFRTNAIFFTE